MPGGEQVGDQADIDREIIGQADLQFPQGLGDAVLHGLDGDAGLARDLLVGLAFETAHLKGAPLLGREFGKGLADQGFQFLDLVGVEVRPFVQQGKAQVRHDAGADGIVLDAVEGCIPGGVEQVGCEGIRDDDLGASVPQVEHHVLHDILRVGEPDEQGCVCLQGRMVTQVQDAISLLVAPVPD